MPAALKLSAFTGEQPRIIPRLLPSTGAQSAINARLDDGSLTPYRASTFVDNVSNSGEAPEPSTDPPLSTIYLHADEWLGFIPAVNAAPGPVAADRLYYTGDGVPKMRVDGTTYQLAVPAPVATPTATLSGSGSGDVSTRIYVYTFVTDFGEESEPSPVTNEVAWQSGYDVILSGIEGDPDPSLSMTRNITKQRFYRSQSGTVGTDFYFIAERNVSDANFTDDVPEDQFAEVLPSRYWNPPPDDLEGLIAMPNGMMAAFVGKQLYFCEPFHPHAWPEIYILTTDYDIVALGALGSTLIVLTEGYPYRVTGTAPDSMTMEKIEANLPCINARGVADLGHSIAWTSAEGLAAYRGDGSFGLVSSNIFSPREWRRLNPGDMVAGQVNGRWIGSYSATNEDGQAIAGSIIIDITGGDASFLIRTDTDARAWFFDIATNFLYFMPQDVDEVRLFDSPTGDTAIYYWKSKLFVLPYPDNFGCILIDTGGSFKPEQITARQELIEEIEGLNEALFVDPIGGELAGEAIAATPVAGDLLLVVPPSLGTGITVGVYADGTLIGAVATTDIMQRLPSGRLARYWEIDVYGDYQIDQITLGRTPDDLKQAADGP